MPSGSTHAISTLIAGSVVVAGMAYSSYGLQDATALGIGFLLTLYINPDLDLNRPFQSKKPKTWLSWLILYPYSRILPHRHWASHFPIISTLIRCLYFFWPIALIIWHERLLPNENTVFMIVLAMTLSDTLHWLLDTITTEIKVRI